VHGHMQDIWVKKIRQSGGCREGQELECSFQTVEGSTGIVQMNDESRLNDRLRPLLRRLV